MKESFLFQLESLDIDDNLYKLVKEIILNLEDLESFFDNPKFNEAINIIKQLNITPAIDYRVSEELIPEIIIINNNGYLEVRLNEEYYPEIYIKNSGDDKYSKEKLKEARNLVDALEMRKSTL